MVGLSDRTMGHVRALFKDGEVEEAARLLANDCAELLPIVGRTSTPASLERIRFAALRRSNGKLEELRKAIDLARLDWRDLLVAADFADDIHAHEKWRPRILNLAIAQQWREGVPIDGVDFGPSSVVLWPAEEGGALGAVVGLVGLDPEPRYKVRWKTGVENEMWQRQLRSAG
jgi:hypothetical protein